MGIFLHQEMPQGDERGRMHGFQLWANLPSHLKMTVPRYQDIHWDGLSFSEQKFDELQKFEAAAWKQEVMGHEELFIELHDHLPSEMIYERELLICRL